MLIRSAVLVDELKERLAIGLRCVAAEEAFMLLSLLESCPTSICQAREEWPACAFSTVHLVREVGNLVLSEGVSRVSAQTANGSALLCARLSLRVRVSF